MSEKTATQWYEEAIVNGGIDDPRVLPPRETPVREELGAILDLHQVFAFYESGDPKYKVDDVYLAVNEFAKKGYGLPPSLTTWLGKILTTRRRAGKRSIPEYEQVNRAKAAACLYTTLKLGGTRLYGVIASDATAIKEHLCDRLQLSDTRTFEKIKTTQRVAYQRMQDKTTAVLKPFFSSYTPKGIIRPPHIGLHNMIELLSALPPDKQQDAIQKLFIQYE